MESNTATMNEATVRTLAVFGFVALVVAGIWLAMYSTRYVPTVVNRLGTAAVYLGSVFRGGNGPSLTVVPNGTSTSTIPFGPAATSTATSTPKKPPMTTPKPGTGSSNTYQSGTTTAPLYGFPDLIVTIDAVGYLAGPSTDTFVASSSVPAGSRPAVRFTIKNVGTNIAGPWRFSAVIPTQTSFIFQSQSQQSLGPNDRIEYTLGFDQANRGSDQTVSVTANFDNAILESTTNNNSASTKLTILGS